MQLFPRRHSFRDVDVQRLLDKASSTAIGLQRASPREAFACNRQS